MNFSSRNPEEDMSMEDILSSIRKYVSEESERKASNEQPTQEIDNTPGTPERVIRLNASQLVSDDEPEKVPEKKYEAPATYNERSSLSTSVVDTIEQEENTVSTKKVGPFAQLANALNSYGKAKVEKKTENSLTVDQLFTCIAERAINDWIEKNMSDIVEQIVAREIEKMKAE